jgi:SpoVK/Ycf46/Vps4 family AAA+-type ATPase
MERGSGSDVGEIRRVLNSFLMFLERHASTSLIIAATNHAHTLDGALFRRFDDLLEFRRPDRTRIRETIQRRLALLPIASKVELNKVAAAAQRMSFAEIVKACDEATKELLMRNQHELRTADLFVAIRERRTFLRRGR